MKIAKTLTALAMATFITLPAMAQNQWAQHKRTPRTTITAPVKPEKKGVQPLHVEGTKLVDPQGNPVVLHGISYGWHNIWPRFWNAESCRYFIKDWNAQVIRASMGVSRPFNEEMHNSFLQNPSLALRCLFNVVDAAIENDAYVIIDWHSHDIFEDDAVMFFTEMATKYKGVPNVMYELFNEPDYESWEEVKMYSEKVIKAIRAIEPDAVILVGCPHWDQDVHVAAADPIRGQKNLMYTMHFYAATHGAWLRERTDEALKAGLPIFVSECAGMEASGDGPLDLTAWRAYVDWMQERGLSWCVWSVSDKVETCSMLIPGASATGNWSEDELKPWAKLVRDELKR